MYCAPNPATSILEILVHAEVDLEDIPVTYRYLEVWAPEDASREALNSAWLPREWRTALDSTRRIGDEWLQSGRTALLIVPCAIVPATSNVLINPAHPDAGGITVAGVHEQSIDRRLFRS